MTTEQVIAEWSTPANYCEPRGCYYFDINATMERITTKPRKHDQYMLMRLGRKLPGTKVHANFWLRNGRVFDLVSIHEIRPIEDYGKMVGFEPAYKFTKSKGFVRLTNSNELDDCIRNFFNIKLKKYCI